MDLGIPEVEELMKRMPLLDEKSRHNILSILVEQFRTAIIDIHRSAGYNIQCEINVKYQDEKTKD